MAIARKTSQQIWFVEREVIDRYLREKYGEGVEPPVPAMTVQEIRQAMIDGGINPEDNEFSRGIIAMREE